MAAQNRHSQDSMTQDAAPQSLYELLIYDNKKLVSKTEGPHIIMRRALKGSTVDIVFDQRTQSEEPSKDQDEDQQEEIRQDTENKKATSEDVEHEENEQPSLDVSESTKEGTDYTEMVSADTISSYLASLTNHGQSDVLRVVDAITELEEAESVETGEENEELPSSKEEQEVKGESKGKKVLKIADIFDSLKKARRKAQQKNYSYTKKVEYEDH